MQSLVQTYLYSSGKLVKMCAFMLSLFFSYKTLVFLKFWKITFCSENQLSGSLWIPISLHLCHSIVILFKLTDFLSNKTVYYLSKIFPAIWAFSSTSWIAPTRGPVRLSSDWSHESVMHLSNLSLILKSLGWQLSSRCQTSYIWPVRGSSLFTC